jgi:hypothetical protein
MNIKKVILLLCFALTVIAVKGQPAGDPNAGAKPAPISGIEWLILGGGILGGIRTYFRSRRQKP